MRSNMRTVLAAALVASICLASPLPAEPDSAGDCLHGRASVRVAACTQAIAAGQLPEADHAALYRSRAAALADAGRTAEAIADLDAAIRLKPDFAHAFAGRGQLRLSRSDWDGALADYSEAIRLNPKLQSAYIGRGFAAYSKGAVDAAIADYTEAISLDRTSAVAFNNRGLALRRKNDLTRALSDYAAALQINPLYARAHINRGYAYEALKQPAEAISDFRQALAIDPNNASAREALARLGAPVPAPAAASKLLADGAALVQKNCAWCHAVGSSGESANARAPRFRDLHKRYPVESLAEPLSKGAVAPHSEMPRFRLSDGEVAAIVAYLNSFAPAKP